MASGGTGKTLFCCWLASQVTKGGFIKGDNDFVAQYDVRLKKNEPPPENVLYISSEEIAGELRNRFIASGGDPERFYIYDRETSIGMNFTEGKADFLIRIQSCQPKLVIIDPWQAFIGTKLDTNRINHIRPAMQQLASIAKSCRCSIILVSHVNKKAQADNLNNAALGSSDFVNAARSALMMINLNDPAAPDERIMVHTKANYSSLGDSLKYHITMNGGLVYDGISQLTKNDIEAAARSRKTVAELIETKQENQLALAALTEAVKQEAVPGQPVLVAYEEMQDKYGTDIFGNMPRPGSLLRKAVPALESCGIRITTKTAGGSAKSKQYKGKHAIGFEIYKEPEK